MKNKLKHWVAVLGMGSSLAFAQTSYDLPRLESLALETSRAVQAMRDQVQSAQAAVSTAGAFPNPEIEYLGGSARPRGVGGSSGDARSVMLTQPLDMPWVRNPRIGAAEAVVASTQASAQVFNADVIARLRVRYFDVLRRDAELKNARLDAELVEGVRSRIALRVEIGEAPRLELMRAEAESLNAEKSVQAAAFRVRQARALLRQAVGEALPPDFVLEGRLADVPELTEIEGVRQQMLVMSPDLARSRAELQRAERILDLERKKRWPTLAVKAGRDQDPDMQTSRIGLSMSIPLWDRRTGPVAEAEAQLARAHNELLAQEFALGQSLESAYQVYGIARAQVTALESGIVRKAEAALKVADAAYRFGERSFLEVVDAQRVYRAARAEVISARHELAAAWVEIERLRALPGGKTE